MNKGQLMLKIEGEKVQTMMQLEETNQTGLALIITHLQSMLNRIQNKFDEGLSMVEKK